MIEGAIVLRYGFFIVAFCTVVLTTLVARGLRGTSLAGWECSVQGQKVG